MREAIWEGPRAPRPFCMHLTVTLQASPNVRAIGQPAVSRPLPHATQATQTPHLGTQPTPHYLPDVPHPTWSRRCRPALSPRQTACQLAPPPTAAPARHPVPTGQPPAGPASRAAPAAGAAARRRPAPARHLGCRAVHWLQLPAAAAAAALYPAPALVYLIWQGCQPGDTLPRARALLLHAPPPACRRASGSGWSVGWLPLQALKHSARPASTQAATRGKTRASLKAFLACRVLKRTPPSTAWHHHAAWHHCRLVPPHRCS